MASDRATCANGGHCRNKRLDHLAQYGMGGTPEKGGKRMSDFLQFVQANGIMVPDTFAAGRWIRCKTVSHPRKRNGSIKLADDGQVGWAQDYAVHAEPIMWRSTDADVIATPIDRALI